MPQTLPKIRAFGSRTHGEVVNSSRVEKLGCGSELDTDILWAYI